MANRKLISSFHSFLGEELPVRHTSQNSDFQEDDEAHDEFIGDHPKQNKTVII